MKKENVHNDSVFGNKNNTSSHYHIKSGSNPVPVGEIVKQCVEQLKTKRNEYQ